MNDYQSSNAGTTDVLRPGSEVNLVSQPTASVQFQHGAERHTPITELDDR